MPSHRIVAVLNSIAQKSREDAADPTSPAGRRGGGAGGGGGGGGKLRGIREEGVTTVLAGQIFV